MRPRRRLRERRPGTAAESGSSTGEPKLLVLASTFPVRAGDGTPSFVADLTRVEATRLPATVLAPRIRGAQKRSIQDGYSVLRFRYFPRRWEDLADGAILENLRARPSRWIQVPFFLAAGMWSVYRAVRSERPSVLHVHWIIPQGVMALVGARGRPWVVTTHGGDLYALKSGPARRLKKWVLRHAGAVTVMNEEMRQLVLTLGVADSKVKVLPMGVDMSRMSSSAGTVRVPGRIVFVGRLAEKKGLQVLLAALARRAPSVPWSLEIIGDGPLRAQLEDQAAALGDHVRFLGQQPASAVEEALRRAEVAVFPSIRSGSGDQDGLPVALLEAMACETAIAVSDLPGMQEMASGDAAAGLVVPSGDEEAWSDAVEFLLTTDRERQRMVHEASERVRGRSVEAVGAQYIDLLAEVAGLDVRAEGESPS